MKSQSIHEATVTTHLIDDRSCVLDDFQSPLLISSLTKTHTAPHFSHSLQPLRAYNQFNNYGDFSYYEEINRIQHVDVQNVTTRLNSGSSDEQYAYVRYICSARRQRLQWKIIQDLYPKRKFAESDTDTEWFARVGCVVFIPNVNVCDRNLQVFQHIHNQLVYEWILFFFLNYIPKKPTTIISQNGSRFNADASL
jgi:hypothetical protein